MSENEICLRRGTPGKVIEGGASHGSASLRVVGAQNTQDGSVRMVLDGDWTWMLEGWSERRGRVDTGLGNRDVNRRSYFISGCGGALGKGAWGCRKIIEVCQMRRRRADMVTVQACEDMMLRLVRP